MNTMYQSKTNKRLTTLWNLRGYIVTTSVMLLLFGIAVFVTSELIKDNKVVENPTNVLLLFLTMSLVLLFFVKTFNFIMNSFFYGDNSIYSRVLNNSSQKFIKEFDENFDKIDINSIIYYVKLRNYKERYILSAYLIIAIMILFTLFVYTFLMDYSDYIAIAKTSNSNFQTSEPLTTITFLILFLVLIVTLVNSNYLPDSGNDKSTKKKLNNLKKHYKFIKEQPKK